MDDETSETKALRLLNSFIDNRRQLDVVAQTGPSASVGTAETLELKDQLLEAWPLPWNMG